MYDSEDKENKEPLSTSSAEKDTAQLSNEYRQKISDYEEKIDKIQYEIRTILNESARKDQCIRTCLQEKEVDRKCIIQNINMIKSLEKTVLQRVKEFYALNEKSEIDAKKLLHAESNYLEIVQKFNETKVGIENYKTQEESMLKNLQKIHDQMTVLSVKYSSLEERYNQQLENTQEKVGHGNEPYKKEIAKLESMVKRLEIKTKSLETALKQKSDECVALSALYDDIADKQSS